MLDITLCGCIPLAIRCLIGGSSLLQRNKMLPNLLTSETLCACSESRKQSTILNVRIDLSEYM
jgi:hypothetical protein